MYEVIPNDNRLRRATWLILATIVLSPLTFAADSSNNNQQQDIAIAQTSDDGLWQHLDSDPSAVGRIRSNANSVTGKLRLDHRAMRDVLHTAPLANSEAALSTETVIELPMPNGRFTTFQVEESPILSPQLQAQYPAIRTYKARAVNNSEISARLDFTPQGFHAYIFTPAGIATIDPTVDPSRTYTSIWKRTLKRQPFQCSAQDENPLAAGNLDHVFRALRSPNNPSGTQLRTYRLAISATGEYTRDARPAGCDVGGVGWPACGRTAAAAQIATTINRVTGIFEREVAISLNLVATNIYDDPATDPFDSDLLGENQTDLDDKVGTANYDMGHVFTQGGNNGAARRGVCDAGLKANGFTSQGSPRGEVFDVDYVAHEMGHQLSASHTWNSNTGSCSGDDQYVPTSAFEPGSASTIMGYAGICAGQNVQANSDAYFHTRSFDQIVAYRDGDGACGTLTDTSNNVPIVDAGPDYTIPRNTPFTLTGNGNDADAADVLTYNWEQYDAAGPRGVPQATNASGPLFRSRFAISEPTRTLPRLEDLLAGTATPWEVLANVNRTMNFRLTARDNRDNGGGVDWDDMQVVVSGTPFSVDDPGELQCGDNDTVSWNVGGGSVAPSVQVNLSDDGVSFNTLLASTANDGTEDVSVPRVLTNTGRLKIDAIDNIFFSVSDLFSIVDTLDPLLSVPAAITGLECTAPSGTPTALGVATTSDLCDVAPTLSNDAPTRFPLGVTPVVWSSEDESGNEATGIQTVEVVDTTAPTLIPPPDLTRECTSPVGTPVNIGIATSTDICDANPQLSDNAPLLFPLGSTNVSWTSTDDEGNSTSANQTIVIEDTTAPLIELSLSRQTIWPPNHKLVRIRANITVSDICDDAPVVRLVSVTSNEPDNGIGDGNTINDIQDVEVGTDDRDFLLRAERSGRGSGRIYRVVYEVEDGSGNKTRTAANVRVPKSRGRS